LPHQWRVSQQTLRAAADILVARIGSLQQVKTFDELLDFVEGAIDGVSGIGPLTIYDIALRIGAKLDFSPEKVYLHAGTREEAKALGLDTSRGILELRELPNELRALAPHEIEDCICIYKSYL
jgi:hypothetical protein